MSPNKSMDEGTTDGTRSIHGIAKKCILLFTKFAQQPINQPTETISTCERRFKSWVDYHGVFAHKSVSLDTQLIMNPEVRDLVKQLLNVLKAGLRQLIGPKWKRSLVQRRTLLNSAGNTSLNDGSQLLLLARVRGAMEGIVGSVDRLHRLSYRIRETPTDYSSLAERITDFAKQLPRDGFEDMTSLILKSKFPKAEDRLITKLTKSVVVRRNRLLYLRQNIEKLRQARHSITTEAVGLLNSMSIAAKDKLEEQQPIKAEQAKQYKLQNQSLQQYENVPDDEPACVTNTTIFEKDDQRDDRDERQAPTDFPGASPWSGKIEYTYPEPPKAESSSKYAVCQFCFLELQVVDNRDPEWWEKHVDFDMDHYICLSDECEEPLCYFKTFDYWMKHMCSEQGQDWPQFIYAKKSEWICRLSEEHSTSFADQDSLRKHLEIHHPKEYFDQRDLQFIVDHGKFALPRDPDICPLCEESVDDPEPAAQQSKVENGKRPKKGFGGLTRLGEN
ncbi:hypothetical protein TrVFT333_011080 [Trichoderma virens FT-333]|nr:hypothetical protein TrVFT333_011080 [Trichoderma virens FT-333]